MGNRPSCNIIWAIPIEDADWKDSENNIKPLWKPYASSPEYVEEGFEDVFYPLSGPVRIHSFHFCGDHETRTAFVGISLWKDQWYGESPALVPTEEQRQGLQKFLKKVGLGKTPALHALLSYG